MIGINKYPDELVSNETKKSFAFGQEYAAAIWSDWEAPYYSQRANYKELREYALGTENIDICKQKMKRKFIKEEHLLVDWNNRLKLMPQLLRNFYNSVDMNEFSPMVRAIDPSAMEIRNNRKNEKLKLFYAKEFIQKNAEMAGGDSIIPLNDVPQSKEQIDLEEETAKPLRVERGEEKAIQFVMLENSFNTTQDQALKDSVELNIMVSKVYTDPVEGIKIDYVNPDDFIFKKSANNPYHTESNYFAQVKDITIGQFKNIAAASGLKFTDDEIRKIAKISDRQQINEKVKIKVLFYTFKTFFQKVYKKKINREKNTISLIDRSDDVGTDQEYNPKYTSDKSEKILDNYDVWFEGIICLDDKNTIIQHKLVNNLAEYKGKIIPPFLVCTPRKVSFIEENKELIDSIKELRYRIIHHRNTLKGTVTDIDPDMIASLSFGEEKIPPKDVLSLYFTQWISFTKRRDDDGDFINPSRGISEVPVGIPQSLYALTEQFVSEVQLLYQAFGAYQNDQARPDPKTLTDLEAYRLSDNTGMRDYIKHLFNWSLMNMQVVSSRINDAFEWPHIKQKFIDNIGLDDVNALEQYRNDRKDHFFALFLDYAPTKQERSLMMQNLNAYVSQGTLDPLDAIEIMSIKNIRTAMATMRLRLQDKQSKMNDFELQKIRENQSVTITSTQVANEEKRKTQQQEYELRAQEKALEFEREAFLLQKQGEIKIQEASLRENNKQALEEFRNRFNVELTEFKKREDAKLRNQIQDKSVKNQEQLIKLRKGEINSINQDSDFEEVNLNNL